MKLFARCLGQKLSNSKRGQSMVELAIIAPILLLLFLGVIEVGWALRGYLVLVNVNREAVRYGVKNGVLDYSEKTVPITSTIGAVVGYERILSHTLDALGYIGSMPLDDSHQRPSLPLKFLTGSANNTLILSHFVIDTGLPCAKYQGSKLVVPYEFDKNNCNCNSTVFDDPQWFTRDDLILSPDTPGYSYYAQTYGISQTTRLGGGNYITMVQQLTLENNQLNCTILKTGTVGEVSINNLLVAESFYDQPQLLSVPIVSNALTDPIPFYTSTAMRIVTSRDVDSSDTIGPICAPYPITFPEQTFTDLGYNPDDPQPTPISLDLYEGSGSGNFGWMTWDPDPSQNDPNYTVEELSNPYLAMHDFTDVNDPTDHSLGIGSDVSSGPGVMSSDDVMDELEKLVGKTILIPIYKVSGGTGQNTYYTVTHFARVTITEVCLPRNGCSGVSGSDKLIKGNFEGYADDVCQ